MLKSNGHSVATGINQTRGVFINKLSRVSKMIFRKNKNWVRLLTIALASSFASVQLVAQDVNEIEETVVVGSRASLQSALNKMRDSDKASGVVDSDAIGTFADINVAESLRRISGVMVENDQGEGRYVSVRGMNTDLNAMTINGVNTASPEARRGVMLDGVPSDLLETMTVYKTLTPDLDADTIGGAIDLETLSAFSRDGFFARLNAETTSNSITEDSNNPKLSATLTNRWQLDGGELGAALVISDQSRRIITNNNENGGWGGSGSNSVPNDDYEMRYYDLTRERQGAVLNLDYRTDSGNSYYARMFQSDYVDTEWRAKWETRDILEEDPTINGDFFTYEGDAEVDSEGKNRTETRTIETYQIGAEIELNSRNRMEFSIFSSEAEQDDSDLFDATFRGEAENQVFTYDNSNAQRPAVVFSDYFYNPDNLILDAYETEFAVTTDESLGLTFDFAHLYSNSTVLDFGFKYREREKANAFNFCAYSPADDNPLSGFNYTSIDSYLDSVHGPTPAFDQVKDLRAELDYANLVELADGTTCPDASSFFEVELGDMNEESIGADWQTNEDVLAMYAMATAISGPTTWIYGLRYEDTSTQYGGKAWDVETETVSIIDESNDYGFLAPSLNIKHELSEDKLLRLGLYRSLVRPGFNESRAAAIIDTEDNAIEAGNTELDATEAWNFDLSYEYYIGGETFLGLGAFYKQLDNAIVEIEATDAEFRGQTWDEVVTYENTDSVDLLGMEVSFQTAWDNGFVLVANYTHTEGDMELPADSTAGERSVPFFKQTESAANISIGYDKNGWDVRLAGNYRGEYLDELGGDDLSDRYTDAHFQVDLTARYEITDSLTLTAEAINLNDEPEYYYFGNSSRLSQYDEYGTTYGIGFRYTFQ